MLPRLSAFAVFLLAAAATSCFENRGTVVVRIIDGDTVVLDAPFLPLGLGSTLALRIRGVDAPEIGPGRAKCPQEREWGERSRRFVEDTVFLNPPDAVLYCGWDKYGGRVLGDLLWDTTNVPARNLSALLLMHGMAWPYAGSGPKHDWCSVGECIATVSL